MRTLLLIVTLTLSGCISINDRCDEWPDTARAPLTGNYAGAIHATRSISFSDDRCATLATVAGKPDLDEPSQFMLINTLRGSWGFSADKTRVLQALATNPALTSSASLHLARSLESIASTSGDRQKIADLLAARPLTGPVPTTTP